MKRIIAISVSILMIATTYAQTISKQSISSRRNIEKKADKKATTNKKVSSSYSKKNNELAIRSSRRNSGEKQNNAATNSYLDSKKQDRSYVAKANRNKGNTVYRRNVNHHNYRNNDRVKGRSGSAANSYYRNRKEHHTARKHFSSHSDRSNRYIVSHHRVRRHLYVNPAHSKIYLRPIWYDFYFHLFPRYQISERDYNHRIDYVSGDNAKYYIGEIKSVYGRIYETYYDEEFNEFYIYLGAPYPNHDFMIVITGSLAAQYSVEPYRYFMDRNIQVTGLITDWNSEPEMIIKYSDQIIRY